MFVFQDLYLYRFFLARADEICGKAICNDTMEERLPWEEGRMGASGWTAGPWVSDGDGDVKIEVIWQIWHLIGFHWGIYT